MSLTNNYDDFIIKIDDYYFRILNIVFIKKKKEKL